PWLATAMGNANLRKSYKPVEEVIDEGGELIPALQEFLALDPLNPLNPSIVRKTLRLHVKDSDLLHVSTLRMAMQAVNDCFPRENITEQFLKRLSMVGHEAGNVFSYINSSWPDVF